MSAPTFSDITIVRIDEDQTLRHKDPPPSGLYWVHFVLSARPSPEWVTGFDSEREGLRILSRPARISGEYLTVHCLPEETEHCRRELDEDMVSTNRRYRDQLERQHAHDEREQKASEVERVRALREFGKIKF